MMLSVIIPTCNRVHTLNICLKGLADCLHIDGFTTEVIVTDDSIDEETELYVRKSPIYISYTRGPRKGPASNRNNGAAKAKGEWLLFIDDDCIPDRNLVKAYYSAIMEKPSIKVFEGAIQTDRIKMSPIEHAPVNTRGGNLWSCNFLIQRELFLSMGGFDENFRYPHLEDVDFRERLKQAEVKVQFVSDAFVVHPWRSIRDGIKLGYYQEMAVYFAQKWHKEITLSKLLMAITQTHYGMAKGYFLKMDVFQAIKVWLEHMFVVIIKFRYWKSLYARKFKT